MNALVIPAPGSVEVRHIGPPAPGPTEALVRIEACGICGTTDRDIVAGTQAHHPAGSYPAVLGHEAVGVVIQVGSKVRKFHLGDRVTRPVAIWPGTTRDGLYSAWGGMAEFGIVRDTTGDNSAAADYTSQRQHVVPPELSLQDAVLSVSLSEVGSWMEKLGHLKGKSLVIGGTGFAACVMCQCAAAQGAAPIIAVGRTPRKFAWVAANGATYTVPLDAHTPAAVRKITGGGGADWFLDAAGHQSVFEAGLECLHPGGQCAIYGAPHGFAYRLPLGAVGGDFSVRYVSPQDDVYFPQATRRMIAGELNASRLLSHQWAGLESVAEALRAQAAGEVLKGLVYINQSGAMPGGAEKDSANKF